MRARRFIFFNRANRIVIPAQAGILGAANRIVIPAQAGILGAVRVHHPNCPNSKSKFCMRARRFIFSSLKK